MCTTDACDLIASQLKFCRTLPLTPRCTKRIDFDIFSPFGILLLMIGGYQPPMGISEPGSGQSGNSRSSAGPTGAWREEESVRADDGEKAKDRMARSACTTRLTTALRLAGVSRRVTSAISVRSPLAR